MHCLLIYDIPDDKKRGKVAEICLDYGLDRVQYSAFLGQLNKTYQDELITKIARTLGKADANVQLFVFDAENWARRKTIAQGDIAKRWTLPGSGER